MDYIVIKIGGSILYDENLKLNIGFLKKVILWAENQKKYKNIIFVLGGGRLSRFLLNQVKNDFESTRLKHQVGIKVSHVNVILFTGLFDNQKVKYCESISDVTQSIQKNDINVVTIGGVLEGWSTDMVAVNIAHELKVDLVNKISNIDYIYTSDPNLRNDSKPLENLTWEEYIKIFRNQIGLKHKPGMNSPIDIESSLFCQKEGISFRVSGGNLNIEIDELLKSGTLVSN